MAHLLPHMKKEAEHLDEDAREEIAEEKEKKMGKHKHVDNGKGYCKKCGCDMDREEKREKANGDKDDKKEEKKESKEHPKFNKKQIHQIVEDHEKAEKK